MTRWLTEDQIRAHQARRQRAQAGPAGVGACAAAARLYAPECDVLKAVLATLELHPRVSWAARINSGAFVVEGRFIKAAFKGCSDILGMLKVPRGVLLSVECKSSTGKLSADQAAFRDAVLKDGGMWILARSVDDVMQALA